VKTHRTRIALIAATLVAGLFAPVSVHARATDDPKCPFQKGEVTNYAPLQLPKDAVIKNTQAFFDVEVGSDNRLRDLRKVESSGNDITDALIVAAIQKSTFKTVRIGCVSTSSVIHVGYNLTDGPTPQPTPFGPPQPGTTGCTPLVTPFVTPIRRDITKRGTAMVAVPLDAAATRRGEPTLTKSSGSPILDQEALRLSREAQYEFEEREGCASQPFTYQLELTFN
jgi:TonB family protein